MANGQARSAYDQMLVLVLAPGPAPVSIRDIVTTSPGALAALSHRVEPPRLTYELDYVSTGGALANPTVRPSFTAGTVFAEADPCDNPTKLEHQEDADDASGTNRRIPGTR